MLTLDYSAQAEVALIDRGLPYLRLVDAHPHWRVYAVRDATPIAQRPGTLSALGSELARARGHAPGTALIRVRWSPYWAIAQGSGCVAPDGGFTKLHVTPPGPVRRRDPASR